MVLDGTALNPVPSHVSPGYNGQTPQHSSQRLDHQANSVRSVITRPDQGGPGNHAAWPLYAYPNHPSAGGIEKGGDRGTSSKRNAPDGPLTSAPTHYIPYRPGAASAPRPLMESTSGRNTCPKNGNMHPVNTNLSSIERNRSVSPLSPDDDDKVGASAARITFQPSPISDRSSGRQSSLLIPRVPSPASTESDRSSSVVISPALKAWPMPSLSRPECGIASSGEELAGEEFAQGRLVSMLPGQAVRIVETHGRRPSGLMGSQQL
jgi:hypothetical protein